MEGILGFVGIVILYVIANLLFRGAVGTVKAAGRSAFGNGSFTENMELQFKGMQPFSIRTTFINKGGKDAPFDIYKVEGKGLIPTNRQRNICFITSVIDTTGGEKRAVWSMVDDFQEPKTIAYQHVVGGGTVSPDQGFISWVRVGVVIPEMLVPPRGGNRELMILTRIVDSDITPSIELGFHDNSDPAILATYADKITYNFAVKGYEEAAEQRDTVNALAVKLGVAVAMADGNMDETEAAIISSWIQKILSPYSGQRRENLKNSCNMALKSAFEDGKNGVLSLSEITAEINLKADDSLKYQAIELCLDVMAADGVASSAELAVIKKVAEAMGLDYAELQRLKDQRMVSIKTNVSDEESLEDALGIDPSWSPDQIKKYLRTEFSKWNGRLNTLSDPVERENTQRMLDLIAEARKRYG